MLRIIAGCACFMVANWSMAAAGLPALAPWRISTFTENVIGAIVFAGLGIYIAIRGTEDF